MKKILYVCMLSMCFLFTGNGLMAQEDFYNRLGRIRYPYELDLKKVPLADVLSNISKTSNVSIVPESSIADLEIDLYMTKGQTLKNILETFSATHGLKVRIINNTVILSKKNGDDLAEAATRIIGKVLQKDSFSGIEGAEVTLLDSGKGSETTKIGGAFIFNDLAPGTYIMRVRHPDYEERGEIVEVKAGQTFSMEVMVQDKKSSAKTGMSEGEEKEVVYKQIGKVTDKDGEAKQTEKIILKHAFAGEVKEVISSVTDGIEVTALEKMNMLVLKGNETNLKTARNLIKEIDQPVKQVRITAQVLDVTDNLLKELGVDWAYKHIEDGTAYAESTNKNNFSGDQLVDPNTDADNDGLADNIGYAVGNEIFAGFTNALNLEFINIFNSKEDLINATVNLLHQTDDANINAIPSIVTINGEPADFRVTEEVIVGTIEEEDDDGNSVKQPLFKEAGVIFKVIPTIRDGGDDPDSILLDVDSEVSNFKLSSGYDQNEGAQFKNNIKTKIRVNDGDSIFIGGLKKGTSSEVVSKIPLLGDLPFIGWLFKNTSSSNDVREIYIQITAEIVTNENKNSDIPVQNFRANPIATPGAQLYKIGK